MDIDIWIRVGSDLKMDIQKSFAALQIHDADPTTPTMVFRFMDLPVEIKSRIILFALQLPESRIADHEEHVLKRGEVFDQVAKWCFEQRGRWRVVWDIIERHTRKPAPEVTVVQVAKSLRLVSKDFGQLLNFPFSHYPFLTKPSELRSGCPHFGMFSRCPVGERLAVDAQEYCKWCQNTLALERMFSLGKVWDAPIVPKYLLIRPALANFLNDEYMRNGNGPEATYLTAVGSMPEFVEIAISSSRVISQNPIWRYCAELNCLDICTDYIPEYSEYIHWEGPETFAHRVLDVGQTHLLPNADWLEGRAIVRVCCSRQETIYIKTSTRLHEVRLYTWEGQVTPLC